MSLRTARATRRGTFAGDGLSDQRALTCPVNGARCDQVACIDVGCTAENASVDAERAA